MEYSSPRGVSCAHKVFANLGCFLGGHYHLWLISVVPPRWPLPDKMSGSAWTLCRTFQYCAGHATLTQLILKKSNHIFLAQGVFSLHFGHACWHRPWILPILKLLRWLRFIRIHYLEEIWGVINSALAFTYWILQPLCHGEISNHNLCSLYITTCITVRHFNRLSDFIIHVQRCKQTLCPPHSSKIPFNSMKYGIYLHIKMSLAFLWHIFLRNELKHVKSRM